MIWFTQNNHMINEHHREKRFHCKPVASEIDCTINFVAIAFQKSDLDFILHFTETTAL